MVLFIRLLHDFVTIKHQYEANKDKLIIGFVKFLQY